MRVDYHSAIGKRKEFRDYATQRWSDGSILAFVHDMEKEEIPPEFRQADFIYGDFPWQQGYKVFNDRAGVKGISWDHLVENSINVAKRLGIPYHFTGGKQFAKFFPEYTAPEYYWGIHKSPVRIYSSEPHKEGILDVESYIRHLYEENSVGLDFFCGYGYLGRFAREVNKRAILTDINPFCIGYIETFFKNES